MNLLYWRDLAERVLATFAEAFLGQIVLADWFSVDRVQAISLLERAAIAGAIAALAVAKGLIAKKVGNAHDASLLPAVTGE